jgi:hypothetical protein
VVTATDRSLTARLVLDPAELTVLRACLPIGLSGGEPPGSIDEQVLASLQAREIVGSERQVHRSVLAGFVLLAQPAAVHLYVVAAGPALARRTSIALSDQLLAGLTVEEPSGRAEQFLAGTEDVAGELLRLLPTLPLPDARNRAALHDIEPGRLLVAVDSAAASGGPGRALWTDVELGSGADVARALAEGFVGSLSVTLTVPAGTVADVPVLDRLLWVATTGGWWSLRPHADRTGRPRLDVVPVQPDMLARELAPMLAAVALALGASA